MFFVWVATCSWIWSSKSVDNRLQQGTSVLLWQLNKTLYYTSWQIGQAGAVPWQSNAHLPLFDLYVRSAMCGRKTWTDNLRHTTTLFFVHFTCDRHRLTLYGGVQCVLHPEGPRDISYRTAYHLKIAPLTVLHTVSSLKPMYLHWSPHYRYYNRFMTFVNRWT